MSKIILITGASTGIGAATAEYLSTGYKVIVHYNSSRDKAEKVAQSIIKQNGTPYLVQANLSTEEGCTILADFVKNQFGALDVLINNAGGLLRQHTSQDITWDFMEELFNLNAFSVIYLSSLCVPLLKQKTGSCVVNITSTIIRSGGTVGPLYAAAKGAIDVFTRSLARELAPNIRVNAVAPGVIQTPFHDGVIPETKMKEVIAMTPLKKVGAPDQVAKVVAMLIENNFITGETIDVNGGLYMR